ncbi:hypothetical protein CCHL11_08267 [Colletotrichum chlorophyti]|uniref:BZIP domain-containing protein n=1 Tax=Colletotrichum chlorophyti TaxID=708187 RepID=A0A1Q8RN92_9PEZI|nr:hypothetical protein CCHL11_08267 [Colletotrichum chlorophyti]
MEFPGSADDAHHARRVELRPMPHEVNIRHRGEDWAGITNQKERKKLQNRLNKRRKRRNCYDDSSSDALSSAAVSPDAVSPDAVSPGASPSPCPPRDAAVPFPLGGIVSTFSHCSEEDAARKRAALERFAEQALMSYMTADPCADHHLRLIQFNTINAFTRNAAALGYEFDWLVCAAISPFGCGGQSRNAVSASAAGVPSTLEPTNMQLTTRHHPWLDLFPIPQMRDNLLIAASVLSPENEQRLFDDVMDSDGGKDEWAGLLVWGEPWDPQSWEVSVPFLQRWGWLVRGCPEIIASTNRWRCQRGEKPISTPGFVQEEQ